MCMHSHARKQIQLTFFTEGIPSQEQYLTEGCCPNRCGPLEKVSVSKAACRCCGVEWVSTRVGRIWQRNEVQGS